MSENNNESRVYKFSEGDTVRVRSAEEISQTLDPLNRFEGCLFMNEMWDKCGKDFKVLKAVRHFFDEYRYKMYKTRGPVYLLEGALCKGEVDSFAHRCDHYCYLLWHEDWLETV